MDHAGSPIVRLGEGRDWGVGQPLGRVLAVEKCDEFVDGGHYDVHARDVVRGQVLNVAPQGGMPWSVSARKSGSMLAAAKVLVAAARRLAGSLARASKARRVCRPVNVVGSLMLSRSTSNQRWMPCGSWLKSVAVKPGRGLPCGAVGGSGVVAGRWTRWSSSAMVMLVGGTRVLAGRAAGVGAAVGTACAAGLLGGGSGGCGGAGAGGGGGGAGGSSGCVSGGGGGRRGGVASMAVAGGVAAAAGCGVAVGGVAAGAGCGGGGCGGGGGSLAGVAAAGVARVVACCGVAAGGVAAGAGCGGGGAGCGGAGGLGRRDVGEGGRGWRGMNDAPAAPYWAGMPAYTQLSWVLRSAGQAFAWWPVVPGRSPLPQRA